MWAKNMNRQFMKTDIKMILKLVENDHFIRHKRNTNYSYIEDKSLQKYRPKTMSARKKLMGSD